MPKSTELQKYTSDNLRILGLFTPHQIPNELKTARTNPNLIEHHQTPPFIDLLNLYLHLLDISPIDIATHYNKKGYQWHRRHLNWELTRRNNPFKLSTGLEGYLIGTCKDTPEAIQHLSVIGQEAMDNIKRLEGPTYLSSQVTPTLDGYQFNPHALLVANEQLGGQIARLRINLHNNHQAQEFRAQTDSITKSLPDIHFELNPDLTQFTSQCYFLPKASESYRPIDSNSLPPDTRPGYQFIESLAKLTCPTSRMLTHILSENPYLYSNH
jgi:hypothetical protein